MSYTTRIVAALSLLSIAACSVEVKKDNVDDWNVVSKIVAEMCRNKEPGLFALSTKTSAVASIFVPRDLDETARQSLIQRSSETTDITFLETCDKFEPFDFDKIEVLFNETSDLYEQWSAFYKKNPNVNGIMTFSLPGYSSQGDVAIVQVAGLCGPLCGNGFFWVLRRTSGRWQVENAVPGWVN